MNIALISAVFPPEPVTSALTSRQLATDLVQHGQEVTVITCFPSRPRGRFYSPIPHSIWRRVSAPGEFELHRVLSIPSGNSAGLLSRVAECVSFGTSAAAALITTNPDAIVVNSWPIFGNGLAVLLGRLRNIPVVVSIQDIHPEAIVTAGKLSQSSWFVRLLKALDGLVARHAAALVVISDGFKRFYESERGVNAERIHVIHNWMDEGEIVPLDRAGPFRAQLGLSADDFVVMYAGNVGALAGAGTLIEAADRLRNHSEIVFVIAGSGSDLDRCRAAAAERSLTNVRFHSPWTSEPAAQVHAAADVLVLLKSKGGSLTSVPSKLIGYMLSGRPVIATVETNSDTAGIVAASEGGVCVPPEEPDALAAAILRVRDDPARAAEMSLKGREYAVRHFSRAACLPRLRGLVESLAMDRAARRKAPSAGMAVAWSVAVAALVLVSLAPNPGHIIESLLFHLAAYAGVAGLAMVSFGVGPRGLALALMLLPCGLALELGQLLVPGRTFQWSVIAASGLGIGIGLLLSLAVEMVRTRTPRDSADLAPGSRRQ